MSTSFVRTPKPDELVVTCGDGVRYDFVRWEKDAPQLTRLMCVAFSMMLSKTWHATGRLNSNRTRYYGLGAFLTWAGSLHGREPVLGYLLLKRWQNHLTRTRQPTTACHRYQMVARATRLLMEKGRTPTTPLPRSLNYELALSEGSGGATLADIKIAKRTPAATNAQLLSLLLRFCWARFEEYEARLIAGERWRRELATTPFEPPERLLSAWGGPWSLNRQETLELACKFALSRFGVTIPTRCTVKGRLRPTDRTELAMGWIIKKSARHLHSRGEPAVTLDEVRSYLHPGGELVSVCVPILVAAGVNPSGLERLRISSLIRSPHRPEDAAYILSDKPRARAEVQLGPFSVGDTRGRTVPRLWERLASHTQRLRSELPPHQRDLLLVYAAKRFVGGRRSGHPRGFGNPYAYTKRVLRRMLSGAREPEWAPLHRMASALTPRLIRTTALNITAERLNFDFEATARLMGHADARVYDSAYLTNATVKASLDTAVRAGTELLENWLRQRVQFVPNSTAEIARALGTSHSEARAIQHDEYNSGYGYSLVRRQTVVVDTPLNCLRMLQWTRKLRQAEQQMIRDRPERWHAVFAPQLRLFTEALSDFPRRTRQAAEQLDREYELPFPDIT